ncbi:hypothetical protein [Nitratireductor alexandrii]|uniref:hypothetical protein n=1 Tax=Nitratireductor alexandrii TaxID=2448161 RepID=UPI000FD74BD4|nr:hypothetical protein [Nitratireductor alexandrii]
MRLSWRTFFFAVATGALATVLGSLAIGAFTSGEGIAQISQTQGNDASVGNVQIGTNSGTVNNTVNSGDITIIFKEASSGLTSTTEIERLDKFRTLLGRLERSGALLASRDAMEEIANSAVALLSTEPLVRDVIADRQFSLRQNQTHSIAGSRNRVTYLGIKCGGARVDHIALVLNGAEDNCVGPGEAKIFAEGGRYYELVYDGLDYARGEAKFSIYPVSEDQQGLLTPVPDAEYGEIFRWNRGTYHCNGAYIQRGAQWFCSSRPQKR